MKTAAHLPAIAFLLAMSAPACAWTPLNSTLNVRATMSFSTESLFGVPGVEESLADSGTQTFSFLNESIGATTTFDSIEAFGYGPVATLSANASAQWTRPGQGSVNLGISYAVQGNGLFPANLGTNAYWVYSIQTDASRLLFSGSWELSGTIAQLDRPAIWSQGSAGWLPVNYPAPGSFSIMLPAHGEHGVAIGLYTGGPAPGSMDGNGSALARVNWTINAVPEPASWAMLVAGFGLAGASLRRQRARLGAAPA